MWNGTNMALHVQYAHINTINRSNIHTETCLGKSSTHTGTFCTLFVSIGPVNSCISDVGALFFRINEKITLNKFTGIHCLKFKYENHPRYLSQPMAIRLPSKYNAHPVLCKTCCGDGKLHWFLCWNSKGEIVFHCRIRKWLCRFVVISFALLIISKSFFNI